MVLETDAQIKISFQFKVYDLTQIARLSYVASSFGSELLYATLTAFILSDVRANVATHRKLLWDYLEEVEDLLAYNNMYKKVETTPVLKIVVFLGIVMQCVFVFFIHCYVMHCVFRIYRLGNVRNSLKSDIK